MRSVNQKGLTVNQELFVEYLLQGYSQRKAYKLAFPDSINSKPSIIDNKAYLLFHTEKVFNRYNELKEQLHQEMMEKAVWTKEQAMYELKTLLENNKKESVRYEEAYLEEMEMYNKQIKEREQILANVEKNNKNPNKYISRKKQAEIQAQIDELKMAKIRCNRRHQSNRNVNDAILNSVQQLNTMLEFDKPKQENNQNNEPTQIQIVFGTDFIKDETKEGEKNE